MPQTGACAWPRALPQRRSAGCVERCERAARRARGDPRVLLGAGQVRRGRRRERRGKRRHAAQRARCGRSELRRASSTCISSRAASGTASTSAPTRRPPRKTTSGTSRPISTTTRRISCAAVSAGKAWSWSASRPNVICDFAPGRARNIISIVGAYAAICRELGVRLDFPGHPDQFRALTEVTDAGLLARGLTFMATAPACRNQAFNITNGDIFRWQRLWPRIAAAFGIAPGVVRTITLADWMRDKEPVWDRIVEKHGLQPSRLDDIAQWNFADWRVPPDLRHRLQHDQAAARRLPRGDRHRRDVPGPPRALPRSAHSAVRRGSCDAFRQGLVTGAGGLLGGYVTRELAGRAGFGARYRRARRMPGSAPSPRARSKIRPPSRRR